MNIGKILSAKDWSQKTLSKVTKKGSNQFIKTKTVVTPMGSTTIKLKGDALVVEGGKITFIACKNSKITPKVAAEIFFNNFERLFNPKYDATPAIKELIKLEKLDKFC